MSSERVLTSIKRSDVPSKLLNGPCFKRLYFYALMDWAILLGAGHLLYLTPYYLAPLWMLVMAGRLHAFGVILHDLTHLRIVKKGLKVRLLEILVGYPIGTSVNAMAYHHLRHHRHTMLDNDPYYNINKKCCGMKRLILTFKKGLFFVPFWITRSFVGVVATFIPSIRTPYARIFLQDVSGKDLSQHSEVIICAREDIFVAMFHLGLIFLAIKFEFLLFAYYMVIPAAGVFCIYRLLIEHEYEVVSDRSVYSLMECTFDHHTNMVERILVGPRNIGYHCVHHIHPTVGLHHLPALNKWYRHNSEYFNTRQNRGPGTRFADLLS